MNNAIRATPTRRLRGPAAFRFSRAGSVRPVLLALLVAIVIGIGFWALLREAPYSGDPLPLPAPPSAEPVPERSRARASAKPTPIEADPVANAANETAAPARQRAAAAAGRSRAARFTSHSELLTWIEATATIADPEQKKTALIELGRELAAENVQHALSLAGGISNAAVRRLLYEGIFAMHASVDPRAALRAALALDPDQTPMANASRYRETRNDYHAAMLAVMNAWTHHDPRAAMAYLDQLAGTLQEQATLTIYKAWAEQDPEAALTALQTIAPERQAAVLPSLLTGWASTDPAGAARYASTLSDAGLRNRLYLGITRGFMESWDPRDPHATADWAIEVFPGELLQRLLPTLYAKWAESDPVAAAEHALQTNARDTIDIETTMAHILRRWARRDPDAAIAWIDQRFVDNNDYVWAVTTLLNSIRYKDPQQTAQMLERIPFTYADGTPGAAEVARLMAAWCIKDSAAAVAWAEGLQDPALRAVATKSLAANWASRNYDAALAWADSLSDSNLRAYALSNVALRQAMHGMEKSADWIRRLPSGFIRARTAAGFTLGALLRVKDDTAAADIKQQLAEDALDIARISRIVQGSNLDEDTKSELLGLFD